MIIIEIESSLTSTRSGVKEGKPWSMTMQQILVHGVHIDGFPSRYPRETTLQLDEKNPVPYAPGKYVIDPAAFYFGDFNRLALGRMRLQPLAQYLTDLEKQLGVTINRSTPKAA